MGLMKYLHEIIKMVKCFPNHYSHDKIYTIPDTNIYKVLHGAKKDRMETCCSFKFLIYLFIFLCCVAEVVVDVLFIVIKRGDCARSGQSVRTMYLYP